MFRCSYETTAGSILYSEETRKLLLRAKSEKKLVDSFTKDFNGLYLLVEDDIATKDIARFDHPYYCEDGQGYPFWVVDFRAYASKITKDDQGEKVVVLPTDGPVSFGVLRTLLEMNWYNHGGSQLLYAGDVPLRVFAQWITALVRKRFTLDPAIEEQVRAIVAYYYLCLHIKEVDFNERIYSNFLIRISKTFNIQQAYLEATIKELGYLGSFNDLVGALNKLNDRAMQYIDSDTLYTIIASSWAGGADNRSILNVCIEFPPVFVAMVVKGATENFYKRTVLNSFTEKECRRGDINKFVLSIRDITKNTRTK